MTDYRKMLTYKLPTSMDILTIYEAGGEFWHLDALIHLEVLLFCRSFKGKSFCSAEAGYSLTKGGQVSMANSKAR